MVEIGMYIEFHKNVGKGSGAIVGKPQEPHTQKPGSEKKKIPVKEKR